HHAISGGNSRRGRSNRLNRSGQGGDNLRRRWRHSGHSEQRETDVDWREGSQPGKPTHAALQEIQGTTASKIVPIEETVACTIGGESAHSQRNFGLRSFPRLRRLGVMTCKKSFLVLPSGKVSAAAQNFP